MKNSKARASELKDAGNEFFAKGEPQKAVEVYTEGLQLDPENHLLFSNRAAAYLKLGLMKEAVKDAKACVALAPEWPKGYTRLAQAELRLRRLDDCEATIKKLEEIEPENRNIKQLREAAKRKRVFLQLEGKWFGRVSPELGGYVQTFDFKSESEVIVEVFGRAIAARLRLDTTHEPAFLDLLVESEPGQPAAPEVKHIFKIDEDDVLHLCSPYMTPPELRPTSFEGPAYVTMKRGDAPVDKRNQSMKKKIMNMDTEEKCETFARSVIELLPKGIPDQTSMSDEAQAQLMLENVKFQTAYYEMKEMYGDEIEEMLRQYLDHTSPYPSEKLGKTVDEMRLKMQQCGLFPSDEQLAQVAQEQNGGVPVSQAGGASTIESLNVDNSKISPLNAVMAEATAPPKTEEVVTPGQTTPGEKAQHSVEVDKVQKDPTTMILAVGAVALAVAVIAVFASRKSK